MGWKKRKLESRLLGEISITSRHTRPPLQAEPTDLCRQGLPPGVTQVLGPSSHGHPTCQVVASTHVASPERDPGSGDAPAQGPQPGSLRSPTGSVTAERKGVG